jgi:outer membrane receptor protein involved in Fe transport
MVINWLCACCLLVPLASLLPDDAAAQSTVATVFGTVFDEHHAVLAGAAITLTSLDTGETRALRSGERGTYRIIGLLPGRYALRVVLMPFADHVRSNLVLGLSEEAAIDVTMARAGVTDSVTVAAEAPIGGMPLTTLGRRFTTAEIEQIPVAARDFATLAVLSPGIGAMAGSMRTNATGITSAGQNGRNNTFLIDGLSIDDNRLSNIRGSLSLDAIKEFMVLSNAFSAEYGQASGAIISVLTRSGANQHSGRVFYYHRDDAWDAIPGSARLVSPSETKSRLQQQVAGGFFGGPIRRDRAFFFGSIEQTRRDTEQFVTSAVLQVFRPGSDARLPVTSRSTLAFGRADVTLGGSGQLTLRYRLDRARDTNQATDPQPAGLIAPERHADITRLNQDAALLHNLVIGARGLNEMKVQSGRRTNDSDVSRYCPGCASENRPGVLLGKSPTVPVETTERRWQVVNTLTWLVPDVFGDHTVKFGADASRLREAGFEPAGFDGIFTFGTNTPFNPSIAATYPVRYLRNEGTATTDFNGGAYAAFAQDSWTLARRLTVNTGVRWDYQDAPGISHDVDNVAPRLGLAFTPQESGDTTLRASYGVFYDQVLLIISSNALRAEGVTQTLFSNPGYPDPFGFNPRRPGAIGVAIPSATRLASDMDTPATTQASVGVRQLRGRFTITVDGVWARGRHLLRSSDLNYPALETPGQPRPDPAFQRILVREAKGNSWYGGLHVGLRKRHSARHSYAVAYTLSSAERDVEDWEFLAQDQRNYAAERGPASSDARHRISASTNLDLPFDVRLSTLVMGRSALPYNINGDLAVTDRPVGVKRNAARGGASWQIDVRLSKAVVIGRRRVELLADAFNLTNQRNWTAFDGVVSNATFGSPTSSGDPRQVQLGIRVDF